MEPQEYAVMRQVEDIHWWYQALHERVLDALDKHPTKSPRTILDAGCGTGGMLAKLPEDWICHGLDLSPLALSATRARSFNKLTRASVTQFPYADESFDAILLLDVLYHRAVKEPDDVLQEVHRVLRPGGIVIINVPAYDWLRSSHDRAIHTERRFDRRTIEVLFKLSALKPLGIDCWNSLLLPVAVGVRLWRSVNPANGSDVAPPSAFVQHIGKTSIKLERQLSRPLPFGLSIFAVAKR